jgi:hypothetical protein
MEIRIKKHGVEYESIESKRPIRLILSNGVEYELRESFNSLVVNLCSGSLSIKPEYTNQVSLRPLEEKE